MSGPRITLNKKTKKGLPALEWFDNADYSDLVLMLDDGREIRVHKLILCAQNKYFEKLCGVSSSFAEARQAVIELKDDNADATEQVLRHLYGFELPRHSERSWRFWLDLMITANKYLEPQLSTSAERKFRAVAEDSLDADAVLDVYQSIKSDLAHHDGLIEFAETLRKDNLLKLQKNKRYQGLLSDDPDLLASHFEILDQLGLSQDMVQKRIHVCDWHSEQVLKTPDYGWAACCFNNCLYPHVSGRNVFLPKSG